MKFLDEAKVYMKSGKGGNGCISFRREKFVEFGGPDGGDGGRGGDIYIECIPGLNTLIDYRYQQHFTAGRGMHGMGSRKKGKNGNDVYLNVPMGTQVLLEDKQTVLYDFTQFGQKEKVLVGGNGGFGNEKFKSSTNQAPRRANPGLVGEELWVWLRLKLLADVGLVGAPNAGKSTFLSVVSAAKPKIADYPFTTMIPQLGVVDFHGFSFVMADIPGLIAGASRGIGLGTKFLGHIERCKILVHLIDATQDDVVAAYCMIRKELQDYGAGIEDKHEIIALNKCDSIDEQMIAEKTAALNAYLKSQNIEKKVLSISAATGNNIDKVLSSCVNDVELGIRY